ncbi:MAG: hypothetical protein K2X48_18815 [Chitinophagaceae bacterium]|nr:hypothetical protein [Chitinophagaceae bacterium]
MKDGAAALQQTIKLQHNLISMSNPSTTVRPFTDAKPLSIRIWHWATALFFSVSVITVSINEFILDGGAQIHAVTAAAEQKGVTLEREQTRAIVSTFREPIWELHKYAGFGICLFGIGV